MVAIPKPILKIAVLLVVVVIAVVAIFFLFPSGPDTNTQSCPGGECPIGTKIVTFAVDVNIQGCQPWFQPTQPQINSLFAYDTTKNPSASFAHSWDLFGTNMNVWVMFTLTYPSGLNYKWTSTQYAVNAGNGGCSNAIDIIGYFQGPQGSYFIGAVGYSQAINCWPSACSIQSTTVIPKGFGL